MVKVMMLVGLFLVAVGDEIMRDAKITDPTSLTSSLLLRKCEI